MRQTSFALDGEAVLLGVDGFSNFEGLHSRKHNDEVQFYAFDVLMSEGDDLRPLAAFAGIWTPFNGNRGTKSKPMQEGRIRSMTS
jgi:hypothetical protein